MPAPGDVVHILHVIAPSRRLVVTPDMGLEGVIEDDEETKRKVVSSCCNTRKDLLMERGSTKWLQMITYGVSLQQRRRCSAVVLLGVCDVCKREQQRAARKQRSLCAVKPLLWQVWKIAAFACHSCFNCKAD
jgi:hypothetical protein